MAELGILIPGIAGATASTLAAGVTWLREKNLPQMRWGMVTEIDPANRLPLPDLADIVVGGWDLKPCCPGQSCIENRVFASSMLDAEVACVPNPTTFPAVVLPSDYAAMREEVPASESTLEEAVERVRGDIRTFKSDEKVDRIVVVNLSSPPKNTDIQSWHADPVLFRERLAANDPGVTSIMVYALAAIEEGCPFIDFTPTDTLTAGALLKIAEERGVPVAGRDGSTGQTLMKSVISHMFKARHFQLDGWYSVNLLGNHDGLVLSDPDFAKSKIQDKKEVIDTVYGPEVEHLVDIRYFRPKKDGKEAWDAIEFRGWLGEPMSMKINWLGRDSVLAAPLVLDLARLLAFATSRGLAGLQVPLGVFFKHPLGTAERRFFPLLKTFEDWVHSHLE